MGVQCVRGGEDARVTPEGSPGRRANHVPPIDRNEGRRAGRGFKVEREDKARIEKTGKTRS